MNVIAPIKPEAQSEIVELQAKPLISAEERARRKAAIDYGRGSVRLEGFIVPPYAEELYSRYINGELTRKELTAKIEAHYKP